MKDYIAYRRRQLWRARLINYALFVVAIGMWSAFFIGIGLCAGSCYASFA